MPRGSRADIVVVTAGNAELVMMALVIIMLVLVFAVIWLVFVVPMEKGLHERRMQLIQRRLREKEEQMKREQRAQGRHADDADDESHR